MGRLLHFALVAACYHPSPNVGVPCADNGHCPSGQLCDPLSNTCVTMLVDAAPDAPGLIGPGAMIIPMDAAFQDTGQLKAFGLVYQLLQSGVAVDWIIKSGKAQDDADFTLDGQIADHDSGVAVPSPASYAGGPFLIPADERAMALPIVNAWIAAHPVTVVHDVVAGDASPDVRTRLTTAPAIAVFGDTNDAVAFSYLNAASIPDGSGNTWGSASLDVLTEAAVAGASTTDHRDGALFAAGAPKYRVFVAMHYAASTVTPEVAAELRAWLADPHSSAVVECLASATLENAGLFLTTAGVTANTAAVATPVADDAADPHAQLVGAFTPSSGALGSITLAAGSQPSGLVTIMHDATTAANLLLVTGHLDGDASQGTVTYLGGHSYTVAQPMSANPGANGARLFLDGIFASTATTE